MLCFCFAYDVFVFYASTLRKSEGHGEGDRYGTAQGIDLKTSGVEGAIYIYVAVMTALRKAHCNGTAPRSDQFDLERL